MLQIDRLLPTSDNKSAFFVDRLTFEDELAGMPKTDSRRLSSTCIRTLIKSKGYNRTVEADPPEIPARNDVNGVFGDFDRCHRVDWLVEVGIRL